MARPVAVDTVSAAVLPLAAVRPHPLRRFVRRYPLGAAGTFLIVAMLLLGIFANRVAPYDPVAADFGAMFIRPGPGHWFGAVVGVISAYFGGTTDLVLQRLVDILISFPIIILAMAIVAILGTGTINLIVAIALSFIPRAERVVRASALAIRATVYVEAARAIGAGHWRIIFRHMFPNVGAPYLVMLTAFLGQAILLEASLSFLGLGVSEPTPAWGLMLRGAAVDFVQRAPWLAIVPGLAITVTVLAFNVLGDALRDALDPRLRT